MENDISRQQCLLHNLVGQIDSGGDTGLDKALENAFRPLFEPRPEQLLLLKLVRQLS